VFTRSGVDVCWIARHPVLLMGAPPPLPY